MSQESGGFIDELTEQLMARPDSVDLVVQRPIVGVVRVLRLHSHLLSQADLVARSRLTADFVRRLEEGGIEKDIDQESIALLAAAFRNPRVNSGFMFELAETLQEARWTLNPFR